MNTLRNCIFSAFVILLLGCEKELPEEVKTEPVFFLSGQHNGQPFEWHGGEQNMYMHSNMHHDAHNVYVYESFMAPQDCNSAECPGSFHFQFRDATVSTSMDDAQPADVIHAGNLAYRDVTDTSFVGYQLQLFAEDVNYGSGTLSYNWRLNTGQTSTDKNPTFIVAPTDSVVEACLEVENQSTGDLDELCYDIILPGDCTSDFTYYLNNKICYLQANASGGTAPYDYLWDLQLQIQPTAAHVMYTITPNHGLDKVCLSVEDAQGQLANRCKQVVINPDLVSCVSNFGYERSPLYQLDNTDLSQVSIIWRDETGKAYSSERYAQPATSFFAIQEVEGHTTNQHNQATSRVKVSFSVVLYGQNETDQVIFENVNGTIAVAHP